MAFVEAVIVPDCFECTDSTQQCILPCFSVRTSRFTPSKYEVLSTEVCDLGCSFNDLAAVQGQTNRQTKKCHAFSPFVQVCKFHLWFPSITPPPPPPPHSEVPPSPSSLHPDIYSSAGPYTAEELGSHRSNNLSVVHLVGKWCMWKYGGAGSLFTCHTHTVPHTHTSY